MNSRVSRKPFCLFPVRAATDSSFHLLKKKKKLINFSDTCFFFCFLLHLKRRPSLPPPRVCFPRLGLQARVQPRFSTDPALALHPGAAEERGVPRRHRLAGRLRRVRHQGPGRGGPSVGGQEVQTTDELRQAQPGSKVRRKRMLGFTVVSE